MAVGPFRHHLFKFTPIARNLEVSSYSYIPSGYYGKDDLDILDGQTGEPKTRLDS
jgi:hypothetical protein